MGNTYGITGIVARMRAAGGLSLMPPMHIVTYTDDTGTHTGAFEFYESALTVAAITPDGEYIGQRVWPRETV